MSERKPIIGLEPKAFRESARLEALALFPIECLQKLDVNSARSCQTILGHGATFGFWETPETMIPHFKKTLRCIDLRQRILARLRDHVPVATEGSPLLNALLDEGVLWLTRLALLMRMAAGGMADRSRSRSLDGSTVAQLLYRDVNKIVARGIIRRLETSAQFDCGFAKALTPNDLREFRTKSMDRELRRLTAFQERDIWTDVPPTKKFAGRTTRLRSEVAHRPSEGKSVPYQPIPDDYLSTMGPRVLWLIKDLGPNLIHLLETLAQWFAEIDFASTKGRYSKLARFLARYFEDQVWKDRSGVLIIKPPFPIRHGSQRGKNNKGNPIDATVWPLRNWVSVANTAVILQSAHLWITLLMMAGRVGEIITLPRDCIEWARDGKRYVNGRTYKLNLAFDGEKRQWPAPDILVDVLAQQVKLVEVCERIAEMMKGSGDESFVATDRGHLLASLGSSALSDPQEKLGSVNNALMNLAARIGLTCRPGGINLHAHRFRKTIARLAGLAIDGSPKVLMRLLGHKDITMTLGYMLTDPAFAKEIDDITRELRIMRAQSLINDMHVALHTTDSMPHAGHGGAGASVLSTAVRAYEEQLHKTGSDWGVDSSHELAVLLSNNGQTMRLVNAYVVCTKSEGEVGLCSNKKGAADTGNCQSECINRIEDKTGRRDTERVIPIAVAHAQQAIKDNDLLAAASYARQLKVEIKRYPDIAALWLDTPEVVAIMGSIT